MELWEIIGGAVLLAIAVITIIICLNKILYNFFPISYVVKI